jgi:hypothetical protein
MICVFDFKCVNGHVSELFEDAAVRVVECPKCDQLTFRQIAAPRAQLEGFSGAFPGAAAKWEANRESHMAVERRNKREHDTYK